MKKPLFVLSVIGGLAIMLLSGGTYAADPATNSLTHDPKIQERFERQQQRIDNGLKKGLLTKDEAALVQGNLDRIKAEEAKLKAAGQLTVEAKKRLNHKLDLNSKMIDAEKKNPIVQILPNPASPPLQTPSTTPSTTPLPIPTPSTPSTTPPAAVPAPSTTPPAASLPVPSPSTPEGDLKRSNQEREQDSHRDMGRRHMSKEEHERMKAERKAEREKRKAERKARHHERDKDDNDDEDKDDDKDDENGHDRDRKKDRDHDHDKGKKKGKHGRERD